MRRRMQGVTLFELILVMLIVSIVGFGFAKLTLFAGTLYQHQVTTRAVMTQAGFVVARLRDSLQTVLPGSVQVRRSSNQFICLDSIPLNHTGLYARWKGDSQQVSFFMPELQSTTVMQYPQAVFFEGTAVRKTYPYRHFSWVLQASKSTLVLQEPTSLKPAISPKAIGRFFMATDVQSFCLIPTTQPDEKRPFADLYWCRQPASKQTNNWLRRVKLISKKCDLLASQIVATQSTETKDVFQSIFDASLPPFTVDGSSHHRRTMVSLNFSLYSSSPVGDFLTKLNQRIQAGYER